MYGLKKIPVLDLKPSVSLGVKLPFSAPNVFTPVYTSKEQTKYNLINFMLTDRGERQFNVNFGAGLRSRLFEQITNTTLEEIKLSLTSQIEAYFNNIQVGEIAINSDPDRSYIDIIISYRILNINESDQAVIQIQNL